MPTKAAPRVRKPAAVRATSRRRSAGAASKAKATKTTKLAWHQRLRGLRGYGAVKPMFFIAGFAAIGVLIMTVSHAATVNPVGVIVNVNGKCLTDKGGSTANNNPIVLGTCDSSASQQWTLQSDGTIRNQGRCLDMYKHSKKAGAAVVIYQCNGNATQQWKWTTTTATANIVSAGNKLCVSNTGNVSTDGNPIQVAACSGDESQQWTVPQATTVTPTPPPPAPSPTPTPTTSTGTESAPVGDLPGWKQTFVDDFTKDAVTGSWATSDPAKIVYTGDHGGQWVTYPDGWSSTYTSGKPGYQPGQVLSVHDGVLDFYLHSVNGLPSGANPSPLVTGTSQYQAYGRYAARIKSDTTSNYHAAWLLWPQSDTNGGCAESDFPEGDLDSSVTAFAHHATKCSDYSTQDAFPTGTRFDSGWHTYVQEWGPGYRKYYVDGNLIGTSTTNVWAQPERWQMQVEPGGSSGSTSGHFLVDWVAGYSYSP